MGEAYTLSVTGGRGAATVPHLHALFEVSGTLGRLSACNSRFGKDGGGAYRSGCFFGGRELDGSGFGMSGIAKITKLVEKGRGLLE